MILLFTLAIRVTQPRHIQAIRATRPRHFLHILHMIALHGVITRHLMTALITANHIMTAHTIAVEYRHGCRFAACYWQCLRLATFGAANDVLSGVVAAVIRVVESHFLMALCNDRTVVGS